MDDTTSFSVEEFIETNSVIDTQRAFRQQFGVKWEITPSIFWNPLPLVEMEED